MERRGQDTGVAGPGGASRSENLRWLYVGRALRSFTTAFLTVVFPLYLAQAGYGSVTIGAMLTGSVVTTAALVVGVGLLADRIGPRPVLVSLGLVGAVGAGVVAMTTNPVALMLASGLGGVGRGGGAGSGGAFGPFFPAEQSMLASSSPPGKRTAIFGYVGFVGVLAAAAGSLVALVPAVAHGDGLSWIAAYRVVFWLGAALSVVVTLASLRLRAGTFAPRAMPADRLPLAMPADRPGSGSSLAEGSRQGEPQPGADRQGPQRPSARQRDTHRLSTRQLIGRLGLTNALNGLGIGFIGPLLTYWFHVRYGAGPGEIGTVYMVVNLASAIPYLGAARVTRRLGPVRTVVVTRGASTAFLLAMAWMPTFPLAGVLYAVRMIVNSFGMPARQSYVMGVADERRRGTVAAMGTLPAQLFGTITPVVGGALMVSAIDAPIFGAAFFMTANVIAYYFAFRHVGAGPARQAPGVAGLAAGESADV
ncbi:MAG: MFS transporter [Acidimicrobiales bacterium]